MFLTFWPEMFFQGFRRKLIFIWSEFFFLQKFKTLDFALQSQTVDFLKLYYYAVPTSCLLQRILLRNLVPNLLLHQSTDTDFIYRFVLNLLFNFQTFNCFKLNFQGRLQSCRKRGGQGGTCPPHFLADQLTLSQPGGAHYPHLVLRAPPDFQTLRQP